MTQATALNDRAEAIKRRQWDFLREYYEQATPAILAEKRVARPAMLLREMAAQYGLSGRHARAAA